MNTNKIKKGFQLVFFILVANSVICQVNTVICHKKYNSNYYDKYKMSDIKHLFLDQSLMKFNTTPEDAICSYFSIQDRNIFQKYTLNENFFQAIADAASRRDTSKCWIKFIYRIDFQYSNTARIVIVRYILYINNLSSTKPQYIRLLYENKNGNGFEYFIDHRTDDEFLNDITKVFGTINKSYLRVLFSIDKPETKKEKNLLELLTSKDGTLHINTLINLHNNNDPRLKPVFD